MLSGAASAADGTSNEFPEESAALIAATAELFDRVEAKGAPSGRMPVMRVPFHIIKSSFERDKTRALTRNGPVDHLTGYRITWYPTDRMLGTVDFMGTWDGNQNLVCGYLTWDLTTPEAPVLQRISANFVNTARIARGSASEIEGNLLNANCAFGKIDANYHFFDLPG